MTHIERRTYTIDGVVYTACVGYGAQLYSREKKELPVGTCRVILDRLFTVYRCSKTQWFGKTPYEIAWSLASPKFEISGTELDSLRKDLFRA